MEIRNCLICVHCISADSGGGTDGAKGGTVICDMYGLSPDLRALKCDSYSESFLLQTLGTDPSDLCDRAA